MFEPRPYKNISEFIGTMGNVLLAGERSKDPEFKVRYLHLFDIMVAGLSSFVDKEFFADANKTLNVVKLLNPLIKQRQTEGPAETPGISETTGPEDGEDVFFEEEEDLDEDDEDDDEPVV